MSAPALPDVRRTHGSDDPTGLDPRTKLVLVVAVSLAVMAPGGLRFVPSALLLGVGLAVWEGAWRRAIGLPAVTLAMWVIGWLLPLWWPGPVAAMASVACNYRLRFVVSIGVCMHLVATTSPTRLSAGLRAWRTPRPVAVTLAVMLRFFPVVAAESAAVLDAMRLRGLTGTAGVLRHPVAAVERFTVPMIAASLRASEDLSASAILRGLGSRHRLTAMHPPRFGAADTAVLAAVTALVAVAFVLPVPLA